MRLDELYECFFTRNSSTLAQQNHVLIDLQENVNNYALIWCAVENVFDCSVILNTHSFNKSKSKNLG